MSGGLHVFPGLLGFGRPLCCRPTSDPSDLPHFQPSETSCSGVLWRSTAYILDTAAGCGARVPSKHNNVSDTSEEPNQKALKTEVLEQMDVDPVPLTYTRYTSRFPSNRVTRVGGSGQQ